MSTRDPWLDNAKMTLVTLVVVGHAWILLPDDAVTSQAYDFLYFWHMPAFVFVTGYLSRGFTLTGPRLWQLVRTVAVPYVVFECAIALFRIYVGGEELDDLFLDPHWPLWYLSALFCWRLVTPFFKRLPGGVPIAVVLSLAGGMWAGDTFDLARVLGFLPFFVLGLKATPERLEWLRSRSMRVVALLVLAVEFVLARFLDSWAGTDWLYYRSYDSLDTNDLQALGVRASLLLLGVLGAAAFLALVPRLGGWFATMGSATLVVYLFHGFAVKGAEYAGFPSWADDHVGLAALLLVLAAVGLALLLASPPVASRLADLVDPFGYAERRAHHAVDLTMSVVEHEAAAPALQDALDDAPPPTPVETHPRPPVG